MSRFEPISAPSSAPPLDDDAQDSPTKAPQAKADKPPPPEQTDQQQADESNNLEKQATAEDSHRPTAAGLEHTISHVPTHDITHVPTSHTGADDVYDRFSLTRKNIITAVLSFCGFLAPISSTTVLAAIPEVADTFSTSGTTINISNALYMLFMGISPMFWGPIGQVYGRRWVRSEQNKPTSSQALDSLVIFS